MDSTLVGLPIDTLEMIFSYLDSKSLLDMREVCKATKQLSEVTALNQTKTIAVDRLKVVEKIGQCKIDFTFVRNDLQSKLFFLSAVIYLKASVFFHLQGMNTSFSRWDSTNFIEQMTPFVKGAKFNTLEFYIPSPEVFSLIRTFLEGTTVNELDFLLNDCFHPIALVLALVKQVQTTAIRVTLGRYIPEAGLCRLAKVVDSISISGSGIFMEIFGSLRILAYEILRYRCSYLDVTDSTLEFDLTKGQVLSGMLERKINNKPFYFAARTNDGIDRKTWPASARNHVIEIIEDKNGFSKNIIEVRHSAMKRRM